MDAHGSYVLRFVLSVVVPSDVGEPSFEISAVLAPPLPLMLFSMSGRSDVSGGT